MSIQTATITSSDVLSEAPDSSQRSLIPRIVETVRHYADLGFTSFGGPGVHVLILKKRFVDNLEWVDKDTFADLFALGNALPGPGSTQLAFSIAVYRNGVIPGLIAFLLWSLPCSIAMAGLGAGVQHFPQVLPPIVLALLTGLNAAAVGLIALAAYQLALGCITDKLTRLTLLGSASFGICYHAPWMYPVLIAVGGVLTLTFDYRTKVISYFRSKRKAKTQRHEAIQLDSVAPTPSSTSTLESQARPNLRRRQIATLQQSPPEELTRTHASSALKMSNRMIFALLAFFAIYLISIIVTRAKLSNPPRAFDFYTNMIIVGTIIFGGGPVVIPNLRAYTVENGWVSSRDFLLGFAVLQAMPGPNFGYASYLGVLANPANPVLGAFLGWLGIFSPGILLKLSLLPLYNVWRSYHLVRSILRGLSAAASGLVFCAVWQLFLVGYIYQPAQAPDQAPISQPLTSDPFWAVVSASAFVLAQWFSCPPYLVIGLGAVSGLCWFAVTN